MKKILLLLIMILSVGYCNIAELSYDENLNNNLSLFQEENTLLITLKQNENDTYTYSIYGNDIVCIDFYIPYTVDYHNKTVSETYWNSNLTISLDAEKKKIDNPVNKIDNPVNKKEKIWVVEFEAYSSIENPASGLIFEMVSDFNTLSFVDLFDGAYVSQAIDKDGVVYSISQSEIIPEPSSLILLSGLTLIARKKRSYDS